MNVKRRFYEPAIKVLSTGIADKIERKHTFSKLESNNHLASPRIVKTTRGKSMIIKN